MNIQANNSLKHHIMPQMNRYIALSVDMHTKPLFNYPGSTGLSAKLFN